TFGHSVQRTFDSGTIIHIEYSATYGHSGNSKSWLTNISHQNYISFNRSVDVDDEMIASHGGNIVCARLTESLWMKFLQRSGKLTVFDVEKAVCPEERTSRNGSKHMDEGSWREPTMPPPMPLLSSSTQFV
ncbi:unnamed protein product, partial [Brugia timori]|uniref:COesterase domain-containing protein n=1 Tax=Brugia timori TaxID=42155 RepID=A0A0R3QQL4_9BILA